MGVRTGNPTWQSYPSTATMVTAGALNNIEAAIDASAPVTQPLGTVSGNYTLVAADKGKAITTTSGSASSVTVPAGVFAAGDRVDFVVTGAGLVTFVAGSGLTLNGTPSLVARAQWSGVTVLFLSGTSAVVIGDLATP